MLASTSRGYTGRRGARRAAGAGRLTAMVGGGRARGEQRTLNMRLMSVTRDVSQLSAWLKAYAFCRGSQAGRTRRGGLRAPGEARRAASNRGARSVQGRGCNCIAWGGWGWEQRT